MQFRETAGRIVNQSIVKEGSDFPVGLRVQPGKTLALVGRDIFFDGGRISAPGGRISLGSVAGNSFVNLTSIVEGWALEYRNVQNFQDIHLSQGAFVDTTGESSGDILIRGRQISITNNSFVAALNEGVDSGGFSGTSPDGEQGSKGAGDQGSRGKNQFSPFSTNSNYSRSRMGI